MSILYYSILVGAPRAQSTLETQQNINETGAIYKCTFDKSPTGNCSPFIFDKMGSHSQPNEELTYNNEKKVCIEIRRKRKHKIIMNLFLFLFWIRIINGWAHQWTAVIAKMINLWLVNPQFKEQEKRVSYCGHVFEKKYNIQTTFRSA